jgi:hypothetical protein
MVEAPGNGTGFSLWATASYPMGLKAASCFEGEPRVEGSFSMFETKVTPM